MTATVYLRDSAVHYLTSTILLGSEDSGLSFEAYQSETPVVSGGVHIEGLTWTKGNNGV